MLFASFFFFFTYKPHLYLFVPLFAQYNNDLIPNKWSTNEKQNPSLRIPIQQHHHIDMGGANWHFCFLLIIHTLQFLCSIKTIHGMIPQSPVQCNSSGCTLRNSYGAWGDRKDCSALNVTYPTTEEELRLAVSYAVQNNLKIKVVTRFSHTIPKLACPQGNNTTFLISTEKYRSAIQIDAPNMAVTADAGMRLSLFNHVNFVFFCYFYFGSLFVYLIF